MTEKVIFEDNNAPQEQSEEMDGVVEFATAHEYISSAVQALTTVLEIDTAIMNKTDEKRILRVKRQSIRLLSYYINELYDETFDPDTDTDES